MFVIDTNILIYYANGDKIVADFFDSNLMDSFSLLLPTIVVAEFFTHPKLKPQEKKLFAELLPQLRLIPLDFTIAVKTGSLRNRYKLKLGDAAIAATAFITHATLVTRNVRDFKRITDLKIQSL